MSIRYRISCTLLALLCCVSAGTVFAHGGTDKPLFVATGGTDTGNCQIATAPCRTISYAMNLVGKGGQIRVASGSYTVKDADEVFHLLSGAIDIRGGYRTDDGFRTSANIDSLLIGVPSEYREILGERGFKVLADRKGIDPNLASRTQKLLALHQNLKSSMSSAECLGGSANGLPCDSVDLLSHIAFGDVSANPAGGADVWGFVDLNTNREYAIMAYDIGTAVFDVTDATNPREVGFVDGQSTVWRDIKIYQFWNPTDERWNAFAYITTDGAATDGMFVIDLSELPHRIRRSSFQGDFATAHNVYATNTDFGTGLSLTGAAPTLVIAGSNNGPGAYRSYSLENPQSPSFVVMPGSGGADYMHDAASMIITDSRKDTQCANPGPYCEVLFDFNELTFDIWDITNSANPVLLNRKNYSNVSYTHSGWWSEDKQFLFVHDELDELNFNLPTTLRVFSLADLLAPSLVGSWSGPTTAIDHNGFVRGNRYYMSNYSRGLTILDISNAQTPSLAGRLDTFPGTDGSNFVGAWGTYPFFHSGNIAISDINSGFYMAEDRSLDVPQGSFSFSQAAFGAAEGEQLTITIQRNGGSNGNVSVGYDFVPATATSDDVPGAAGVLNWADGDMSDKSIFINIPVDVEIEPLERALIKLVAPTGGATLAAGNIASLYVGEAGQASTVEFAQSEINVSERGFATAVAVLERSGSTAGTASVNYTLSAGDADAGVDFQGPINGSINWNDGDADPRWIEFSIADDGTGEPAEFFELTLSSANGANIGTRSTLRVNIGDGSGVNSAPNSIAGASQTVNSGALVTLDGSQSNDPDGDSLTYQWTQTAGTTVTLSNANTATASFTAPTVSSDMLLQFSLFVSDAGGQSSTAATSVTVSKAVTSGPKKKGGGSTGLLLLTILAAMNIVRRITTRRDAAGLLSAHDRVPSK